MLAKLLVPNPYPKPTCLSVHVVSGSKIPATMQLQEDCNGIYHVICHTTQDELVDPGKVSC